METTLSFCTFNSTMLPSSKSLEANYSPNSIQNANSAAGLKLNGWKKKPATTVIRAAISRSKKEVTVDNVKQQLENCYLLAGIRYKGMTVKQLQELRKALPESAKLLVAKNTLVGKAIEGTQWENLKPCMKGMNAWLFVHSEEIPKALLPYRTFIKEKKLEDNDFTGAVFEGKFYEPAEFKTLETMPTKAEVYAKLLGSLKSPGVAVVGTLKAPATQLVMVLKAYVKKLEEEAAAAGSGS